MKKRIFDMKELKYLGAIFIAAIIIFKIAFYKEQLTIVVRMVFSLFWLFVLPGYFLMIYWKENIRFVERTIAGTALGAGVIGILSYYTGLLGIHTKIHFILLPILLIIIGILFNLQSFDEGTNP